MAFVFCKPARGGSRGTTLEGNAIRVSTVGGETPKGFTLTLSSKLAANARLAYGDRIEVGYDDEGGAFALRRAAKSGGWKCAKAGVATEKVKGQTGQIIIKIGTSNVRMPLPGTYAAYIQSDGMIIF